jgi:hypothetical protein
MGTRRKLAALALSALALVACEALFDDPIQCRADADCARFGAQARCDVIQGVCVARSGLPDDASVTPGPDTGPPIADAGDELPYFDADKCAVSPKPVTVVPATAFAGGTPPGATSTNEITQSLTLGCDKEWLIQGYVYVRPGVTLTIEPGTTIKGDKATNGGLFVLPGARIVANGLPNLPIVFTSSVTGTRAAADWRGLVVLGSAPRTGTAPLLGDANLTYGGTDADDNSGTLRYVRVEYSALGLQLGGVGRGTTVDYVQVRKTTDNCFFFHGGTVNTKHLACQYPGDEAFEWELGYDGRAQFLVAQRTPAAPAVNRHGMQVDASYLRAYNVTLCGISQNNNGVGVVVRNGSRMELGNSIITRYSAGFDLVGNVGTPFDLRSILFKNNVEDYGYTETDAETDAASPLFDDDLGFDENGFLEAGANNSVRDAIPGCDNPDTPAFAPPTSITNGARALPNDPFFDATATFFGAFRDANDKWATSPAWAVWSSQ